MARVLIPLAQGCEELEAVTIIDLLRRADVEVISAGLDEGPVICSRKTVLLPDTSLEKVLDSDFDMVVLPGGLPGADNLGQDARIQQILERMAKSGKYIGAICAAPKVLANAGLLDGKKATGYPGILEGLNLESTELTSRAVQIDGNVITSRGPGTALDFALELIGLLSGEQKRREIEAPLVRAGP